MAQPHVGDLGRGVACGAFFGISGRTELYSHLAAVAGDRRGRGIGFALKVHQRAWALQAGVDTISWTYDPLVRRNAHVNVGKLRAAPVEYLPNFYGARTDNINGSLTTDRVLVRWHLARPETQRACAGEVATPDLSGAEVVLSCGPDDEPVEKRNDDSRRVLVAVPPDIAALRKARPDVAGAWRAALEQHLGNALMKGARVTGFTKQGYYVVDRAPATQEETR
jgi:predicted GNAT superfamily acetyltransferase